MRHANKEKDNDNGAQIVKGCKAMHRDRAPSWITVDRRRGKKDFCQEFLANVMVREGNGKWKTDTATDRCECECV